MLEPRSPTKSAADAKRNQRFFMVGMAATIALVLFYGITAKVSDPLELYQGLAIIVFSVLPGLLWAKSGGSDFPVFEVFMLTALNTYALPLLSGHSDIQYYSFQIVTTTGWIVLLFQAAALATFSATTGRPGRSAFWTKEILSKDGQRFLGYAIVLNTLYIFCASYTTWIPYELNSTLRAIFSGIGIVCTFVQSRRWGQNDISQQEKIFFSVNVIVQVILSISSLFLVAGISLIVLGLLGYISGARRFPFVFCLASFALVAILHNGKSAMREKYWDETSSEMKHTITVSEMPGFFSEWIQGGLNSSENGKTVSSTKLVDRSSLFQILCLVVYYSPDIKPFLYGETYAQIPGQFVPRILWPDKPVGHISTYTLSIYYNLQNSEDTARTTIGFGLLSEAYANFGFMGAAGLGALIGYSFKRIRCLSVNSPLLSNGGLLLVLLMAWSFLSEYTLSIWLSSLFQACVTVLGIPMILRKFL